MILTDWRIHFNSHSPEFEQLVNILSLFPHLLTNNLLTPSEQEYFSNPHYTNTEKVQRLLSLVHSKGIEGLLRAIEQETTHTGHQVLYKKLTRSKLGGVSCICAIL